MFNTLIETITTNVKEKVINTVKSKINTVKSWISDKVQVVSNWIDEQTWIPDWVKKYSSVLLIGVVLGLVLGGPCSVGIFFGASWADNRSGAGWNWNRFGTGLIGSIIGGIIRSIFI